MAVRAILLAGARIHSSLTKIPAGDFGNETKAPGVNKVGLGVLDIEWSHKVLKNDWWGVERVHGVTNALTGECVAPPFSYTKVVATEPNTRIRFVLTWSAVATKKRTDNEMNLNLIATAGTLTGPRIGKSLRDDSNVEFIDVTVKDPSSVYFQIKAPGWHGRCTDKWMQQVARAWVVIPGSDFKAN
jgi:hypothetical protein